MADSNAIQSQGTLLKMGDGGGPETFTTIAEVRDITGPSFTRKSNDVTPIDATFEQILAGGVARTGSLTFNLNLIPGSATHGIVTGLMKKWHDNIKTNFKLIFTNDIAGSATYAFAGWVVKVENVEKVDAEVTANVEIKLTGTPTLV
jgi:hypothetical protein